MDYPVTDMGYVIELLNAVKADWAPREQEFPATLAGIRRHIASLPTKPDELVVSRSVWSDLLRESNPYFRESAGRQELYIDGVRLVIEDARS